MKSSMNTAKLEIKNDTLSLEGSIGFDNVVFVWQSGLTLIEKVKNIKVDLQGLKHSDSSGLALLSAWVRAAREQKKEIMFIHTPDFMQDIFRVCGLDGVLPILWEN